MYALLQAFPANDFAWLWGILLMPLIGGLVIGIWGKRLGHGGTTLMALAAIAVPFLAACVTCFSVMTGLALGVATKGAPKVSVMGWEWLSLSRASEFGQLPIEVSFSADALSCVMVLMVTLVGGLCSLYSVKYMAKDAGYHRYFALLNLLVFSMLVLVLADNLPVLFVGWEGVGLCSYLLIGYFFHDERNLQAARRAFITNRVGDFGLIVAMAMLLSYCGRLDWSGIASGVGLLQVPIELTSGVGRPLQFLFESLGAPSMTAGALVSLLLFWGCAGKSAQLPLIVWAPEATVGPIPATALIYSVTTVASGVYLACRMAPVLLGSQSAMFIVALCGALTAVFAATASIVQRDVVKVLVCVTLAQLGFIFIGVGVGAFSAAIFHLVIGAIFGSCLFLCAGSVVRSMGRRIRDRDAAYDVRHMGGLRQYMPITFWSFLAAWGACIGLPLTSGFFSTGGIISGAVLVDREPLSHLKVTRALGHANSPMDWPSWGTRVIIVLAVIAIALVAFSMTRLLILMFFGKFRGWRISASFRAETEPSSNTFDSSVEGFTASHSANLGPSAGLAIEGPKPPDAEWQLASPIAVLGLLSLLLGALNLRVGQGSVIEELLSPVFRRIAEGREAGTASTFSSYVAWGASMSAVAAGAIIARVIYVTKEGAQAEALAMHFPALHRLVYDRWRLDVFYQETIVGAIEVLADVTAWLDKWIVDGVLSRATAFIVSASGAMLRLFQTGRVQSYAALVVAGVLAIGWHFTAPHARVAVEENAKSGRYVLSATEGLGYAYRWDGDGDGHFDSAKFGTRQSIELDLKRAEKRTVLLQVLNAFGRVAEVAVQVERPREDKSSTITRIDVYDDGKGGKRGEVRKPGTSGTSPNNDKAVNRGEIAPAQGELP